MAVSVSFAQFEGSFVMTVKNEKDKEPVSFKITTRGDLSAMEFLSDKKSGMKKTIFSKNEHVMTMLMDNGVGMRMKVNPQKMVNDTKADPPKISRTRESKVIEGYTCQKIFVETAESTSDVWVTDEIKMTMADLLGMFNAKGQRSPVSSMNSVFENIQGVALETVTTSIKTKEKTTMTIHDIKNEPVSEEVFSTDGYNIMDAPMMER